MTTYRLWTKRFLEDRNGLLALIILIILLVSAVFAPYIAPHPEDSAASVHAEVLLQPPSLKNLFGTDFMGRDIFSRIIFGARVSLIISGTTTFCALLIGTLMGPIAGYYEGWIGSFLMRIADIFVSVPQIVMALAVAAALGPGIRNTILALTVTYWPFWTRVVYANILSLKKSPFIEGTKAIGAGTNRILFLHMLPNIAPNIIIRTTVSMGGTILLSALLSYVGLGAQPPTPDWGLALASSREYLPKAWWYALFPGLTICLAVMAFNMLGDTLRDILDPRLRMSGKKN